MALAQLAAPFSALKGKVQGTIYQSYRGATMVKTRTSGGGRDSTIWRTRRAAMAVAASTWRTLTVVQQTAWDSAGPTFPYIDKFGHPQTPSGFQLYCTLNFFAVNAGAVLLTTPPVPATKINYGPLTLAVVNPATINVAWGGTTALSVSIAIFGSYPTSKGVTILPTRMRHLGTFNSTFPTPINVALQYEKAFGTLPQSGRYWIKSYALSTTTFEKWTELATFADL